MFLNLTCVGVEEKRREGREGMEAVLSAPTGTAEPAGTAECSLRLSRASKGGQDVRGYRKQGLSTHHDHIFNFCPDVRPEDAQVFVQFSPYQWLSEGAVQVLSENHLAVLLERLPPAAPGVPAGVRAVKQRG